jgi:hypothetical protein
MLLLPEGQTGEAWESFRSNALSQIGVRWTEKNVRIYRRVRKIAKAMLVLSCLYVRPPVRPSVLPSVHMEQFGFHWSIFITFDVYVFLENMSRMFQFH